MVTQESPENTSGNLTPPIGFCLVSAGWQQFHNVALRSGSKHRSKSISFVKEERSVQMERKSPWTAGGLKTHEDRAEDGPLEIFDRRNSSSSAG